MKLTLKFSNILGFLLTLLFITQIVPAQATSIMYKTIDYKDQDMVLEGVIAMPKTKGKHPGILVIHEWTGINQNIKSRLHQLSELGYVAFAADIYGKGIRPIGSDEAAKISNIYKTDRALTRRRAELGLKELLKIPGVDPKNIAVMGYCFGGLVSLELARSGADIKGVVSFHGALDTPTPLDAAKIKAEVLVLHGADDPYVTAKDVEAFETEMKTAKVKWELVKYGGAVHSFTNPSAGNDNSKGAAYNEAADKKSWQAMKNFFARIFN